MSSADRCSTANAVTLILSELGRMMLPYLQRVEEQCPSGRDQARAVKKLERATLTIGTMCTIGPQLVSELMIRFQAAHPDVEVRVIDAGAPQMIEMLEKGELEVAIVGVPEELPETLHQLPIFEEQFVIVLPPNHRLCASNPIHAAELDKEPYVSRSNCEVFEPVRKELNSRGVFLRQVFSSPRDDWVQGMIKAGLGLGFFPEFASPIPTWSSGRWSSRASAGPSIWRRFAAGRTRRPSVHSCRKRVAIPGRRRAWPPDEGVRRSTDHGTMSAR